MDPIFMEMDVYGGPDANPNCRSRFFSCYPYGFGRTAGFPKMGAKNGKACMAIAFGGIGCSVYY